MPITITIGTGGIFYNNGKITRPKRINKGKSQIAFPEDFTIIDLETTGFDPSFDDIIEIAALRVRGGEIVDTFSTLIKPYDEIDEYITKLTGITNDMLLTAPAPENIFPSVYEFVGEDIIVGHNVNFDINFLYDWFESILGKPFENDFIDTMRIARKALPNLPHHRLEDVATALGVIPDGAHRAAADCKTTFDCFCRLRDIVASEIGVDNFISSFKKRYKSKNKIDLHDITTENTEFDETHPLFGKHCVFTGMLEKMTRSEAAQVVVDIGGICDNNVTKKTNFLILGNTDYRRTGGDKSSKHKKAEEYKLNGIDIEIIPENVFYDMIELFENDVASCDLDNSEETKETIALNQYESEALSIIKKSLPESADIKLERRTHSYLTLVVGECGDFCRLKASERAKWFSLDLWNASDEIKNDVRLQIVKNKNQRHWKIPLSCISDIEQYFPFINVAYIANKER